jgi:hypothetical protein
LQRRDVDPTLLTVSNEVLSCRLATLAHTLQPSLVPSAVLGVLTKGVLHQPGGCHVTLARLVRAAGLQQRPGRLAMTSFQLEARPQQQLEG